MQEALVKRLGPNAHAFTMEITPLAPPSVQLVPAKEYNGAPIGTSYDVRAYVGEWKDLLISFFMSLISKPDKRTLIKRAEDNRTR